MRRLLLTVLVAASVTAMVSVPAWAGFKEGMAAYTQRDFVTAVKEFRPVAGKGNKVAQFLLGLMYDNGSGVPRNQKTAATWYRLAADQDFTSAQFFLGMMHQRGRGVTKDAKKAVKVSHKIL